MSDFNQALAMCRRAAASSAIKFDGILSNAFVMRVAVGNAYDLNDVPSGTWHRTTEVVSVGSTINYDYVLTADGTRLLILDHECERARQSFDLTRRHIEINPDYFGPLQRAAESASDERSGPKA